jgi:hypothetical protein
VSFTDAILLCPVAVALHVAEEWGAFPRWARRHVSAGYSDREYVVTHVLALVSAPLAVGLARAFPTQPIVSFVFFALVVGPGIFWNAWFHAGATILTRTYCPGLVTGVTVYLPLSVLVVVLAVRDGLSTPRFLFIMFGIGAVVHALEVGHNVFKRW